uniref:Uncharacterized protein n=1 Tax=Podarcis muralis TaxID=64176 RepID=A0A670JCE1_PODMU
MLKRHSVIILHQLQSLDCCQRQPNALFRQDLKRGQKRYFYSIMRIYDSKAPREMLYRRYVINLQRQNVQGECSAKALTRWVSLVPPWQWQWQQQSQQPRASLVAQLSLAGFRSCLLPWRPSFCLAGSPHMMCLVPLNQSRNIHSLLINL